jgi:hypothetical protein
MGSFAAVLFGQFDPLPVNLVDRADMNAVGADNLHMLPDTAGSGHCESPLFDQIG